MSEVYKCPKKPKGFRKFDNLMRKLVKVAKRVVARRRLKRAPGAVGTPKHKAAQEVLIYSSLRSPQ